MIEVTIQADIEAFYDKDFLDQETIDKIIEKYDWELLKLDVKFICDLYARQRKDQEYLRNLVHFCNTGKHI